MAEQIQALAAVGLFAMVFYFAAANIQYGILAMMQLQVKPDQIQELAGAFQRLANIDASEKSKASTFGALCGRKWAVRSATPRQLRTLIRSTADQFFKNAREPLMKLAEIVGFISAEDTAEFFDQETSGFFVGDWVYEVAFCEAFRSEASLLLCDFEDSKTAPLDDEAQSQSWIFAEGTPREQRNK